MGTNPLLGRRQFVVHVTHPNMASVPKKDLCTKLASMYKVHDQNTIILFGFKHDFGGGRSTGFGLIYDNLDKLKKFSPNFVLKSAAFQSRARGRADARRRTRRTAPRRSVGRRRPRSRPPVARSEAWVRSVGAADGVVCQLLSSDKK